VANFLAGGAAASVLARENGVDLTVVDAGVAGEALGDPRLIDQAQDEANAPGVSAKAVTPFMLQRIHELTNGRSLATNVALVLNNARVAAGIARAFADLAT